MSNIFILLEELMTPLLREDAALIDKQNMELDGIDFHMKCYISMLNQ